MGFIPIFLTLGGFVMLFIFVVDNSIKNKRKTFEDKFFMLKDLLAVTDQMPANRPNLVLLEQKYLEHDVETRKSFKPVLSEAKLHLYQYNRLVSQKPYSFVAKITGRHQI